MTVTQTAPKRPFLRAIFLSPSEARLRAGWRLLIQTILMVALTLCLILVLIPFAFMSGISNLSGLAYLGPGEILEFITILVSVFLARRFLDRRSFASLGLELKRSAVVDLLAGIAITFVMMGGIFLGESWLGWLKFKAFAWQIDSAPTAVMNTLLFLLLFVVVGWNEELLFRGYHLQTILSGTNLFWGAVVSSLIFGLAHLGNPNATWVSAAGIFFAGLFFALAYIRTGQLWLPIGIHIGWNFFEGVVFGFPVSGLDIYPLSRITVTGPVLWTGGAFGPEAGLIVLPALVTGALLILLYGLARKKT